MKTAIFIFGVVSVAFAGTTQTTLPANSHIPSTSTTSFPSSRSAYVGAEPFLLNQNGIMKDVTPPPISTTSLRRRFTRRRRSHP